MKCKENDEIINEIIQMKNLRPNSIKNYNTSIDSYTSFIKRNMKDLIQEAIEEEESNISWRNRKVRKYLIKYKESLNKKYRKGTAKKYYTTVCATYRAYEVEINQIPVRLNNNYEVISYDDIPTQKELQKALPYMDAEMQAFTITIVSTGLTIVDMLNLTIQDFLDSTKDYHNKHTNFQDQLKELYYTEKDMVGTWKLKRQKTNKDFYTFTTPEANAAIIAALKKRNIQGTDEPLFPVNPRTIYRN